MKLQHRRQMCVNKTTTHDHIIFKDCRLLNFIEENKLSILCPYFFESINYALNRLGITYAMPNLYIIPINDEQLTIFYCEDVENRNYTWEELYANSRDVVTDVFPNAMKLVIYDLSKNEGKGIITHVAETKTTYSYFLDKKPDLTINQIDSLGSIFH